MKKEKTLSERRIQTLKDDLTPSKDGLYFGEDVKQFIKALNDFMKDKTIIKKGFPNRIVFLEFEWNDFLKQEVGEGLTK